jgi:hypothetical protein
MAKPRLISYTKNLDLYRIPKPRFTLYTKT